MTLTASLFSREGKKPSFLKRFRSPTPKQTHWYLKGSVKTPILHNLKASMNCIPHLTQTVIFPGIIPTELYRIWSKLSIQYTSTMHQVTMHFQ